MNATKNLRFQLHHSQYFDHGVILLSLDADIETQMIDWCTEILGPAEEEWQWDYGYLNSDYIEFRFREAKSATLFSLRWSG